MSSTQHPDLPRIPGYAVEMALGSGGMATVYRARQLALDRPVAIKVLRAYGREAPELMQRFEQEAKLIAALDHPNIVAIYEVTRSEDGDACYVMPLFEHGDLASRPKPMAESEIRRVLLAVLDALGHAHAKGVVHRDVKPANVLFDARGKPLLADFGVALKVQNRERLTSHGRTVGSSETMSPEQARGDPVGPASDLYSFGLLLHELFTGHPIHEPGLSVAELLERARSARTPPLLGVERDVALLVERLESPDPGARPTAAEAVARLTWIQGKAARRARRLLAAALLVVAVLATLKYTADLRAERTAAVAARADADDLIVFMLGDLHERLKGVGRLDVLDSVSDKAREYLSRLPVDSVGDEDLYRRSEVLRQIGMVRMDQGDMSAAEVAFGESLALASDVVARHPERPQWLADLGASHYYLGYFRLERRDLAGAREEFEIYREIADRLVELDGPKREWRLEQAYAHNNLGAVLEKQGDYPEAVRAIERSLAIKRALVEAEPEEVEGSRSLANGLSWLSTIRSKLGDLGASEEACSEELDLRLRLVDLDPRHAGDRQLLSRCYAVRGELRRHLPGRCEDALADFEEARALADELVALDPSNMEWKRDLAVAHRLIADARLGLDRPAEALEDLAAALELMSEVVAREPEHAEWRAQLAQVHHLRGSAHVRRKAWEEALIEAWAARETLAPLAGRGVLALDQQLLLFDVRLVEATALEGRELPSEALAVREAALAAIEPLATEDATPAVLGRMALVLLQLERAPEAEAHVRRVAGTSSWNAELETLAARNGISVPQRD